MRITNIRISNYRGLTAVETRVGAAGVIVEGDNGEGKTSFLRAVRAALVAEDIKGDAVRLDEERAEIFIDMEAVSVRRTINAASGKSTLEVKTSSGDKMSSPAKYLTELLGNSPLDPLDLYLASKQERREKVLAALPITITQEQIAEWAPGIESVPAGLTSMHGLEACERLHQHVYDMRRAANSTVKDKRAAIDIAESEIDGASSGLAKLPKGATVESAQKFADSARVAVVSLEAQKKRAGEHGAKTQAARDRIAGWRKQAAETRAALPSAHADTEFDTRYARSKAIRARLKELEDEFEKLRAEDDGINAELTKMTGDAAVLKSQTEQASSLEKMASDLESSLKDAGEIAPNDFDMDEAREAFVEAEKVLDAARAHDALNARRRALEEDRKTLLSAEQRAESLTKIVDTLRVDAPAQLIAASRGIPGLGIDGESITLDGKSIDKVSGAEQMRFAVEIARRANVRSKILIVDGLERITPGNLRAFVREATRDGYQLIASRAVDGKFRFEHIALEDSEAA